MAGTLEETTGFAFFPDLTYEMRKASGLTLLLYRLADRLMTPTGASIHGTNYGTNLRQHLHGHGSVTQIQSDAVRECLKDEQVETMTALAALGPDLESITLVLRGTTPEGETFAFTLKISDAVVQLPELLAA